jgi:hypothetical protein
MHACKQAERSSGLGNSDSSAKIWRTIHSEIRLLSEKTVDQAPPIKRTGLGEAQSDEQSLKSWEKEKGYTNLTSKDSMPHL